MPGLDEELMKVAMKWWICNQVGETYLRGFYEEEYKWLMGNYGDLR